ncbi:MAG: T9SS type A sorting domain-containing protein [Bacteroidia bacterium]|nr:T9SS type A sorting domain-containing protein [Bacteroidia bacterium]
MKKFLYCIVITLCFGFSTEVFAQCVSGIVKSDISCNGGADGAATVTVGNGTSPYQYYWSNAKTSKFLTNLTAGIYKVTVIDAAFCTTTSSITLSEPDSLDLLFTTTDATCAENSDGSASVSVWGGTTAYSYSWSTGSTSNEIVNLISGIYTVTITDGNNCKDTASVVVAAPASLDMTITVTHLSCNGSADGATQVSAYGGTAISGTTYKYKWVPGITMTSTYLSVSSLQANTYMVTVTDNNNCLITDSVIITEPDSLGLLFTSTDATCAENSDGSASVSVWGGTTAYSYSWNTGSTSNSIMSLISGTYTATITDGNKCKDTSTVVVGAPDSLDLMLAITDATCAGNSDGSISVSVWGGTAPYSYFWNTSETASSIMTVAGTYILTITDANKCVEVVIDSILEPDLLRHTLTSSNISCNGLDDGTASTSAWGGTAPYSYLWSNDDSLWNITNLAAETYYLTIIDENSCWEYDSITISATTFSIGATSTDISCFGEADGSITVTTSDGTSPYTFMWSTGDTLTWLDSLAGGSYAVTVTDSSNACAFAWVNIIEPDTNLYSTSGISDIACNGDGDGSIMVTVMGGTNPYTYLWSDGSNSQNLNKMDGGTYKLTVTDANNCMLYSSIKIKEPDSLIASVDAVDISCNGIVDGSAKAKITGGTKSYMYSWSTGDSLNTASGLAEANYSLTVTDANGCVDITTFSIVEPEAMTASIAKTNVLCKGYATGEVDLTVNGGTGSYTYDWSNNKSSQDQKFLKAGTYSVEVTDGNSCTANASATLTEPSSSMSVTSNSTTPVWPDIYGGDASVSVTGGTTPYSYQWYNGGTSSSIDSITSGVYSVVITDANGCRTIVYVEVPTGVNALSSNVSITIYPNPSSGILFIDYELTSNQQQIVFSIFNQLGELVLERKIENTNTMSNKIDLRLDHLPSGLYLFKMDFDNGTLSKNIILTK